MTLFLAIEITTICCEEPLLVSHTHFHITLKPQFISNKWCKGQQDQEDKHYTQQIGTPLIGQVTEHAVLIGQFQNSNVAKSLDVGCSQGNDNIF